MNNTPFAIDLFDYNKMKKCLSAPLFDKILHGQNQETEFSQKELDEFANALLAWARQRGATRYSHWFSPLSNNSAGKRNTFESIDCDGLLTDKFRGKELNFGEGDASSFPNGGLRQTFEAKGVTRWDYTSFAYVIDDCLYIPVYFHSFAGHSLDRKTPLVKSCRVLDKAVKQLLNLFDINPSAVNSVVGAEQEYFLVDGNKYNNRLDLTVCGRTLFGAKPPKLQQLQDHYFALPDTKVLEFMREVDQQLWKLGILARTEHNEVAPRQYELVPCYQRAPIACDQNQLVMQTLQQVASRHGLVCLLHEKPFDYVSGSGKHNNWSVMADKTNLFEAGSSAKQNTVFVLMIAAVLKATHDYADLFRAFTSSASNARRIGGQEAPTSIVSVFVGEQLWNTLQQVGESFVLGKDLLPDFPHATDRNRTSPFAFTGNKFELRMVGSNACLAEVNTMLNTAFADCIAQFSSQLANAPDLYRQANEIVAQTIAQCGNIVYNGNNYDSNWKEEAANRGLLDLTDTQAIQRITASKNVQLFERNNVLSQQELCARRDVALQTYAAAVQIEGATAIEMYTKQIVNAAHKYMSQLCQLATNKQTLGIDCQHEKTLVQQLTELTEQGNKQSQQLQQDIVNCESVPLSAKSHAIELLSCTLDKLRATADQIEQLLPKDLIPFPTYTDLLLNN